MQLYKELYTGTPNSDIRILCTVHCGRNVNKPSAPAEVEWNGYSSDVILQSNKRQYIYQVRANTDDFWLSDQYGKYRGEYRI